MTTDIRCTRCSEKFPAHVVSQFGGMCPACVAGFTEVPPAPEGTLRPGMKFGRYEILEPVGRGGMGVVYRARQAGLDRVVALKIVSPRLSADADFVSRFQREAKTLASLSHANIVAVHDYGVEEGTPFLVMEFVEGVSLRRLLAERRLPPEEALAIVPQLCDALEYAHAEGVVHRDVKPENILIDTRGRVKIADFGLAVMMGVEASRVTRTDAVLGTPHYMAPEQVENPRRVDHRADIYSMGVVFYEMLTGELPLGHFSVPSSKAKVSRRLDEIVLRALAKEPERRYQRASQLKQDVETAPRKPDGARPFEGYEWRTRAAIFGWPLVHIRMRSKRSGPGFARGIVAIGDFATGVIALGGVAFGGIALGGVSVGLLAIAGLAIGGVALGGGAAGYYALGGGAVGRYVVASYRSDPEAEAFFGRLAAVNTRPRPEGPEQVNRHYARADGFDPETIYLLAEKALAPDSKLEDWRPQLQTALREYLGLLGENVPPQAKAFATNLLEKAFADPAEVHRFVTQVEEGKVHVFLADRGKGSAPPPASLIVCRSAEFESVNRAVVVCLGDLTVGARINDSFVWARGNILSAMSGEPKHSLVYCGGRMILDEAKDSSILALDGVDVEEGTDGNVYVNTPDIRYERTRNDRSVQVKRLPQPSEPRPKDPYGEGMKAYEAGRFEAAVKLLVRVHRTDPNFPTAMRFVGYNVYVREWDRAEEGIPYLDLAYKANREDPKVLQDITRAYQKAGRKFERKTP